LGCVLRTCKFCEAREAETQTKYTRFAQGGRPKNRRGKTRPGEVRRRGRTQRPGLLPPSPRTNTKILGPPPNQTRNRRGKTRPGEGRLRRHAQRPGPPPPEPAQHTFISGPLDPRGHGKRGPSCARARGRLGVYNSRTRPNAGVNARSHQTPTHSAQVTHHGTSGGPSCTSAGWASTLHACVAKFGPSCTGQRKCRLGVYAARQGLQGAIV
jgi:hypothetical protein